MYLTKFAKTMPAKTSRANSVARSALTTPPLLSDWPVSHACGIGLFSRVPSQRKNSHRKTGYVKVIWLWKLNV